MSKIYANKDLGQHFLTNKKVAMQMTDDFMGEYDAIIEIGPGKGVLTDYLVNHEVPFHVIEKDDRMLEPLGEILTPSQITREDALKVDIPELIKEKGWENKRIWLISNLPYNVSVPIFIKLIQIDSIKCMTLMFQKEVAEKIVNFANHKNPMSSLMCLASNYFETNLLCKVAKGSFAPPPKVESAVLSFRRWEHPEIALREFDSLEQFLRRLYQFKRKQMGGILKKYYPIEALMDAFKEIGRDLTERAESLEQKELIKLYISLKKSDRI